MPMGPYKSFKACVRSASRRKGKNKVMDPRRYCGRIYWQTEGRNRSGTRPVQRRRT